MNAYCVSEGTCAAQLHCVAVVGVNWFLLIVSLVKIILLMR